MTETNLNELYKDAQIQFNEFIRKNPDGGQVLSAIFSSYRRKEFYDRKVELLKQYCLDNDIKGVSEDVELYNSSSAKFVFDNNEKLVQALASAEDIVKDLKIQVKALDSTEKINNKIICIGKRKK